jgi:hypothetical protein
VHQDLKGYKENRDSKVLRVPFKECRVLKVLKGKLEYKGHKDLPKVLRVLKELKDS